MSILCWLPFVLFVCLLVCPNPFGDNIRRYWHVSVPIVACVSPVEAGQY